MSELKGASGFLGGLGTAGYARISALLDHCLDMTSGERDAWLGRLERDDPDSARILRWMFVARTAYPGGRFLEEPSLPAALFDVPGADILARIKGAGGRT